MTREHSSGQDLAVLQKWEDFVGWLFDHTAKWPKSCRFTLAQRIQNLALEVLDLLIIARYDRRKRRGTLLQVNLLLERMRFIWRIAMVTRHVAGRGFERAMSQIDECGRMVHGWRIASEQAVHKQ